MSMQNDERFDISDSECHPEPRMLCQTCREPIFGTEQYCVFCDANEPYCDSCLMIVGDLLTCKSHRQRADDDLHQRCRCGKEKCWRQCSACDYYTCHEHGSIPTGFGWNICQWCTKDRQTHRESVARIEARTI